MPQAAAAISNRAYGMGKLGKRRWTWGSRSLELLVGNDKVRVFGRVWAAILESLFPVCTSERIAQLCLQHLGGGRPGAGATGRVSLRAAAAGGTMWARQCGGCDQGTSPLCSGLLQPITRIGKLKYVGAHRQTRPENPNPECQRLKLGGGTYRVG